jgi:hypothetical protein
MATWHQRQRPVKYYHKTKWTVVLDPPGKLCCFVLFNTEAAAREYLKNNPGPGHYVLPPERKP